MAKQKEKTKAEKTISRVFTISKVLLCILPFLALFYLYSQSNASGMNYQDMLESDPILTITFLTAMIQPFAAWLLTIVERRYKEYDYSNALFSLLLIFIAECLLKNWLGIAATAILFYLINKDMPFSIKKEFKEYANWKKILLDGTGGILLDLLSAFVFFASWKIGA